MPGWLLINCSIRNSSKQAFIVLSSSRIESILKIPFLFMFMDSYNLLINTHISVNQPHDLFQKVQNSLMYCTIQNRKNIFTVTLSTYFRNIKYSQICQMHILLFIFSLPTFLQFKIFIIFIRSLSSPSLLLLLLF